MLHTNPTPAPNPTLLRTSATLQTSATGLVPPVEPVLPKPRQVTALVVNPHAADGAPLSPGAPSVLLVTYQWSTLVEMAHLVKQAGCHVDVLCPGNNSALKNSFYDHWINAGTSMASLLGVLLDVIKQGRYQYILIGDDPILWQIYRNQIDALWPLLPILNPAALPILNKVGFARHCQQHGIASPKFHPVAQRASAHDALQALGLPVVVKENYSNGGAGVRIFQDEAAYHAFMDAYDYMEPLLVQQFIVGEVIGAEALFKRGELLQYACSVTLEPDLAPSTKRRYQPHDEQIGALLRQLGQTTLMHGFVNVTLMQEASSQRYYLFEADPRPNKWVPYGKWFGHDFAAAFKVFMAEGEGAMPPVAAEPQAIDCWEVEYFPNHAAKLLNQGRTAEAILHLLDFKKNWRYTAYDPVLLEDKLDCIRRGIKFA